MTIIIDHVLPILSPVMTTGPLWSEGEAMSLRDIIQIPEGQSANVIALAAVGLAVVLVVVNLITNKPRKDAAPVVKGGLPIVGHLLRFIKSPLNLVSPWLLDEGNTC